MARWFPELLAGMGKLGITGMDSVTQLGSMLQVQMKTAGGSDEAANNLKNWMEKIGSGDTVKAYQKAGIDYQGSMNTGLDGEFLAESVQQTYTQSGWSTTVECNGGKKGKAKAKGKNGKKPAKPVKIVNLA